MALNQVGLKSAIIAMLNQLKDDENQAEAIERFAEKLSTAIDTYVKTATVVGTDSQGGTVIGGLE